MLLRPVFVFLLFCAMTQSCCDPEMPMWKKGVNFSVLDSLHSMAIRQQVRSYNHGETEQIGFIYVYDTLPSCKEFDSLVEHLQVINCGVTRDRAISVWNIHTNRDPYASEGVIICRDCDSTLSLVELNKRLREKEPLLIDTLMQYQPINKRYYWFSTFHSRGSISETLCN
jgi:hypothetical protein